MASLNKSASLGSISNSPLLAVTGTNHTRSQSLQPMSTPQYTTTINELHMQREMNELKMRHRDEMYWIKLELDTTRREKEAVEDRMAELFRDLHDEETVTALQPYSDASSSPGKSHPYETRKENEKYSRMVRIMNHQMQLLRNSCDSVVRSLKEEISDIMDDKCRQEMDMMNQLADMEKIKCDLEMKLDVVLQERDGKDGKLLSQQTVITTTTNDAKPQGLPDVKSKLQTEVRRLLDDKKSVANVLSEEREKTKLLTAEKQVLQQQIEKLQSDLIILRSSSEVLHSLDSTKRDRGDTMYALDRISQLWSSADDSIQHLEDLMMEVRHNAHKSGSRDLPSVEYDRVLTTMETASIVHGQIKILLMSIELKLRNNTSKLSLDRLSLNDDKPDIESQETDVKSQISALEEATLSDIAKVQKQLNIEMQKLERQSQNELKTALDNVAVKEQELQRLQKEHAKLQEEVDLFRKHGVASSKSNEGREYQVSRQVLQRLQKEVIQVVERISEKNEAIGKLNAIVDSHRAREAALMEEVQRLQKLQARTISINQSNREDFDRLFDTPHTPSRLDTSAVDDSGFLDDYRHHFDDTNVDQLYVRKVSPDKST